MRYYTSITELGEDLLALGTPVDTGHWQAMKDVPQTKTIELQNVVFHHIMDKEMWQSQAEWEPNLPWAEDHFQERVSGEPLNPPPSHEWWPFNRGASEHKKAEKFSHTYPERFWPRFAPASRAVHRPGAGPSGIRYRYGDLNDVVDLLAREPHTRQAYLPVWFPEDTGAHHGERVPCTLGYHFLLRESHLHCTYPIRSCDFLRHFRDDAYMAERLTQWIIGQLQLRDGENMAGWQEITPGILTMHMFSLHVFEGDMPKMRREYGR